MNRSSGLKQGAGLKQGMYVERVESGPTQAGILVCDPEPLIRAGIRASVESAQLSVEVEVSGVGAIAGSISRPRDPTSAVPAARVVDGAVVGDAALAAATDEDLRNVVKACEQAGRPLVILLNPRQTKALVRGVRAGVRRFVSTLSAHEDLGSALTLRGAGVFLSADLTHAVLDYVAVTSAVTPTRSEIDVSTLSQRETEVLVLLGQGHTNSRIARIMKVRESTVRSHVHHMLGKMNARSRAELIILGHRYNQAETARSCAVDPRSA